MYNENVEKEKHAAAGFDSKYQPCMKLIRETSVLISYSIKFKWSLKLKVN